MGPWSLEEIGGNERWFSWGGGGEPLENAQKGKRSVFCSQQKGRISALAAGEGERKKEKPRSLNSEQKFPKKKETDKVAPELHYLTKR